LADLSECCVGCKAALICMRNDWPNVGYYVRPTFCLVVFGNNNDHIFVPRECPRANERHRSDKNWQAGKTRWLKNGSYI
jgi:hypothetical protein